MTWDGETIYILQGFKPVTSVAIKWDMLLDGNYKGSDRTSSEDVFESNVTFSGLLADLETLETVLNSNRTKFDATFGTGEEVFGMDLDYSASMAISVVQYGKIQQVDFKVYEMPLKIRLLDAPSFIGTASISGLRKSSHQDVRFSEYSITKRWTYDRDLFAGDHYSSTKQGTGIYEADFTQTNDEMKAIRRYLLTTARANSISFPSFDDMTYPFGNVAGAGPFTVKVIDWQDGGRTGPNEWTLKITFSRVLT